MVDEMWLSGEGIPNGGKPFVLCSSELEQMITGSPVVVFVWQATKGRPVVFVSENVRQFGYSQKDFLVLGLPYDRIVHPDDLERIDIEVSDNIRKGLQEYTQRYRIFTGTGEIRWVEDRTWVRQVVGGEVTHYQGYIRDITEWVQAQEDLILQKAYFEQLFHNSPAGIVMIDDQDRVISVNDAWQAMFGYSSAEAQGRTLIELIVPPELVPESMSTFEVVLGGEAVRKQATRRRKDGSPIEVSFLGYPIEISQQRVGIYVIYHDITEAKRVEQEMARLDRLNLVGEMAAGLAHEIRNPMTVARGFIQLLSEKSELATYRNYLDLIIQELDRANSIISEFLRLAGNRPACLSMQSLNSIVEAVLPLIKSDAVTRDMYVETDLSLIPALSLGENEIRQLILNIVRNGLEAMQPGGRLTIKTYEDKGEVVLAVQDQGQGIDPEILGKLSTPFFTTKEKGTGLGLAVCDHIAHMHNAKITVHPENPGTTFSVRFRAGAAV